MCIGTLIDMPRVKTHIWKQAQRWKMALGVTRSALAFSNANRDVVIATATKAVEAAERP